MRMYNSLIMIFEIAPEKFSPSFYAHVVEGKTYTIVDDVHRSMMPKTVSTVDLRVA
jgi:hypothetical protein